VTAQATEDTLDNEHEYLFTNKVSVKTRSNFIKHKATYLILIGLIVLIVKINCIMLLEYTKSYKLFICNG